MRENVEDFKVAERVKEIKILSFNVMHLPVNPKKYFKFRSFLFSL